MVQSAKPCSKLRGILSGKPPTFFWGFAAINLYVDEAMWCEGAFYSTIDAMFARTKGDILGSLVGLLKNRGFSDDVIGPKSPLVAKLKTEIGLRITHMKKEHVTHPGTV